MVFIGKPIGNAFPLAAVITTPEIAGSFNNGMEFFSTFGGNPVACAAGLAVFDVLEEKHIQPHALPVGAHLIQSLKSFQARPPLIVALGASSRAAPDSTKTSTGGARRWFSRKPMRIYSSRRWMPSCKKTRHNARAEIRFSWYRHCAGYHSARAT